MGRGGTVILDETLVLDKEVMHRGSCLGDDSGEELVAHQPVDRTPGFPVLVSL